MEPESKVGKFFHNIGQGIKKGADWVGKKLDEHRELETSADPVGKGVPKAEPIAAPVEPKSNPEVDAIPRQAENTMAPYKPQAIPMAERQPIDPHKIIKLDESTVKYSDAPPEITAVLNDMGRKPEGQEILRSVEDRQIQQGNEPTKVSFIDGIGSRMLNAEDARRDYGAGDMIEISQGKSDVVNIDEQQLKTAYVYSRETNNYIPLTPEHVIPHELGHGGNVHEVNAVDHENLYTKTKGIPERGGYDFGKKGEPHEFVAIPDGKKFEDVYPQRIATTSDELQARHDSVESDFQHRTIFKDSEDTKLDHHERVEIMQKDAEMLRAIEVAKGMTDANVSHNIERTDVSKLGGLSSIERQLIEQVQETGKGIK